MECAKCGRQNRPGARFCAGCGASLATRCHRCDADIEPGARYCDACGADVGAAVSALPLQTRKVVTVVFADLVGSTALHETIDAEPVRRVMERYYSVLGSVVAQHGGTVVKLMGDGVMAAFGIPHVGEDDALRAVRAAVAMQRAFRDLADELGDGVGLRVAVNSGEVVVREDDADVVGDPVNVAARLQEEADDGDVVIGDETRRLVGSLVTLAPIGDVPVKGRSETVRAYRVVSLQRPAGARVTTFVGREEELQRVLARFEAASEGRRAEIVVILGSPGLGKSRLLAETALWVSNRATVIAVRCEPGGATFAPIADGLRALAGLDDRASDEEVRVAIEALVPPDVAERDRIVAAVAGVMVGAPPLPEETFWGVRRLLAALGEQRPVVLALDDLHWAEPLLLDLAEHLVEWSTDAALLVLVAARPELRELRSALASPGRLVRDVIALDGLDASAAARLAADVVGADELPAGVAGHVLATSEGNPLFLGELVRMLVDDGSVRRVGDRWVATVDLTVVELPPTINALLAARIERLRPDERTVLECAAVIGRHFSRAAVQELLPFELRAGLDGLLESLRRTELIEPDATWFLGDPVLRFHHVLIREAAYQRVLKETRAALHVRYADWLAAQVPDPTEHDETLGLHLEAAHGYRGELGMRDDEYTALGVRAATHLSAAGRRALARDDVAAAANLLGRAIDRLAADDPERAELAVDWCDALLATGDVERAQHAIDELGRWTEMSSRLRAWHACFIGHLAVLREPHALHATVDAVSAAAAELAAAADDAGEARAHFVHALALGSLGRVGAAEAALDRALVAARRIGDWRRANAVLAGAPVAALWGPGPVTRASGRCLDVVRVLRITSGSPAVEAVALRCQAVLEALRGRADAARTMIGASRRAVEELGLAHRVLQADMFAGIVELLDGDLAAAEPLLRSAYDGLRDRGLDTDAAQAAALLARVSLGLERVEEAEHYTRESEALAGDDLKAAIAWRGVRAEALARRGAHDEALALARAAVELAAATDALLDHADARVALAAALRAAGRAAEADAEMARAVELWEAKGATVLVDRVRREIPESVVPTADLAPPSHVARRVRPNAATMLIDRLNAAFAARDVDALPHLVADGFRQAHHQTGAEIDRRGYLASVRSLFQADDASFDCLAWASLGDSLVLGRTTTSIAGIREPVLAQWGRATLDEFFVIEVDGDGREVLGETFAPDRLGDAVVRLYERYAETAPDRRHGEGAAATARAIAAWVARQPDLATIPSVYSRDVHFLDHRRLGFPPSRGVAAVTRRLASLFESSDLTRWSVDDVLALEPDALLLRRTIGGTGRADGVEFEREMLQLLRFGDGGCIAREEYFDVDRATEALARFDELAAHVALVSRPVRANLATAHVARAKVALGVRDLDGLLATNADDVVAVHHPTGAAYDRRGVVASLRSLFRANSTYAEEPFATLGDRLVLCRVSWFVSGMSEAHLASWGDSEWRGIEVVEVDASGRRTRYEHFAEDHLGDALVRLYERHAELAPAGPERESAAAAAAALAAMLDPRAVEEKEKCFTADLEFVDHRVLGFGRVQGARALGRALRAGREVAGDIALRVDDVLDARPDAVLMRWTETGTDRAAGGAFEREYLSLFAFGPDGLVTHAERFDSDRLDAALARFDELRRAAEDVIPPNAAWRAYQRFHDAFREGDWGSFRARASLEFRWEDRRQGSRLDGDIELWIASVQELAKTPNLERESERIATFGDRIVLVRQLWSGGPAGGEFEAESVSLAEVDADGLLRAVLVFDVDDRSAAFHEARRRFVAGEAAPYAQTFEPLLRFAEAVDRRDWAAARAMLDDGCEMRDHRVLGIIEQEQGPDRFVDSLRVLAEMAPDVRMEEVRSVALDHHVIVEVLRRHGTVPGGGPFEMFFVIVFGTDGDRIVAFESFDLDDLDAALARFEELRAPAQ